MPWRFAHASAHREHWSAARCGVIGHFGRHKYTMPVAAHGKQKLAAAPHLCPPLHNFLADPSNDWRDE
jgi:hypothetical protein